MKKLYVVGNPVEHSKSPEIHNHWLKKYNLDYQYERLKLSLDEKIFVEQKLDLIKKVRKGEIKGVNITVPFKKKFIDALDEIDESAKLAQAVNTIYKEGKKIIGTNTDGIGFCTSLKEDFNFVVPATIGILGSGGAAFGILSELIKYEPYSIEIWNRTISNAKKLVDNFKFSGISKKINWKINDLSQGVHSCIGLFINTSYLGMKVNHKIDNDFLHLMSKQSFVYDINYNQEFTIFNQMADYRGIDPQKNVNGKYMLIRQAAGSFKKWFNINLNKDDIDEAVNLLRD